MISAILWWLLFDRVRNASFCPIFCECISIHCTDKQHHSPEDQAVLEAEYQRNPKPDKASRMEIVKRVALGEREVQVCSTDLRTITGEC
jgi:hypothetical protein